MKLPQGKSIPRAAWLGAGVAAVVLVALTAAFFSLPTASRQAGGPGDADVGDPDLGAGTCVSDLTLRVDPDARAITLSWGAMPDASAYVVQRSMNGDAFEQVTILPAGTTSFVDDAAPDGILAYRVAADGHPGSGCTRAMGHLGGEPVPSGVTVCAGGLTATALKDEHVILEWAVVPGVVGYEILRAAGEGPLTPYAVAGGNASAFADEAVDVGIPYRYAVVANGLPEEGVTCEMATVTAIPFFPGGHAVLLGVAGMLAAFVLLRRRR